MPLDAIDAVVAVVDRVVGWQPAGRHEREACAFERTPRRRVGAAHRHDDRRRVRVVAPDRIDRGPDHRAADTAAEQVGRADQIVDAQRGAGCIDQLREFGDVARVVGERVALQQADRLRAERHDEHIGRIEPVDHRAEVGLHRLWRALMVPPARDVRLREPAAEQREVGAGEVTEAERSLHNPTQSFPIQRSAARHVQ